jgi:uroporphyrinogen-III synthase
MNELRGKTILITKSRSECKKSLDKLIEQGAEIIYYPTIKILPVTNSSELNDMVNKFGKFDYLVFSSINSVEVFSELVKNMRLDLSKIKIAAVGKSTADECASLGFTVDIIPSEFSAEGLLKKFSEFDLTNKNILLPGSTLARGELNMGLSQLGAQVFSVPIYDVTENDLHTLKAEHHHIQKKHPNIFIFTSPSSFSNFLKLMNVSDAGKFFGKSTLCAIGTTTEEAMFDHGVLVNIVPDTFTIHGVAEAIVKFCEVSHNIA